MSEEGRLAINDEGCFVIHLPGQRVYELSTGEICYVQISYLWIRVRIEHNGGYYMSTDDASFVPLTGMKARTVD